MLCSRLWLLDNSPSEIKINQIWQQLGFEERSQISAELELLSNNQRKVLISLARISRRVAHINKEFVMQTQMSVSSISQSLAVLEQKDYIYRDPNGYYYLMDPLMNKILGGH